MTYRSAMNPLTVVAAAIAVWLAWRAGRRWQHHRRTWTDHAATRAAEKRLRKARWGTLRVALAAAAIVTLYVLIIGVASFQLPAIHPAIPATIPHGPDVSCSPVPWHPDHCTTITPSPSSR